MLGLPLGTKWSMKRGYWVSWFICWALVGHVGTMFGFSRRMLGNLEDVHVPTKTRLEPNIGPSMAQVLRAQNFVIFSAQKWTQKLTLCPHRLQTTQARPNIAESCWINAQTSQPIKFKIVHAWRFSAHGKNWENLVSDGVCTRMDSKSSMPWVVEPYKLQTCRRAWVLFPVFRHPSSRFEIYRAQKLSHGRVWTLQAAGCLHHCAWTIIGHNILQHGLDVDWRGLKWTEALSIKCRVSLPPFRFKIPWKRIMKDSTSIYHHLSPFTPGASFKEILLTMYKKTRTAIKFKPLHSMTWGKPTNLKCFHTISAVPTTKCIFSRLLFHEKKHGHQGNGIQTILLRYLPIFGIFGYQVWTV